MMPIAVSDHACIRARERFAMSKAEFQEFVRLCAAKGARRSVLAKHGDGELRLRMHYRWGVIVASLEQQEIVTIFPSKRMARRKPADRARAAWREVAER